MIDLEIITPQRRLLSTSCLEVTLPGTLGEIQMLEGHASMLTQLKPGILTYDKKKLMIAEGFAELGQSYITVLCEDASLPDEINLDSENKMIMEWKEELMAAQDKDIKEFRLLEVKIERATARINLANNS